MQTGFWRRRNSRAWFFAAGVLGGFSLGIARASAHPHVFVTTAVVFSIVDGRVAGFREYWFFDEVYSAGFLAEFDANGNGALDPEEVEKVRQGAFVGLKEYGYFTTLTLGDKKVDIAEATNFSAAIANGLLIYEFYVPLEPPIDAAVTPVHVSVYDKEYYIEMLPSESNPAAIQGQGADRCSLSVGEDTANPYYFDSVFPQKVTLSCG
jgi:ABC-type uncharacterized transport system substrate-binding protein